MFYAIAKRVLLMGQFYKVQVVFRKWRQNQAPSL